MDPALYADYNGNLRRGILARFYKAKNNRPNDPIEVVIFPSNKSKYLDPFALRKACLKLRKKENPFVFTRKSGLQWSQKLLNKELSKVVKEWKLAQTPSVQSTHPLFTSLLPFNFHSWRASMITALFTWKYELPHVMCLARHKSADSSLHYYRKSRTMNLESSLPSVSPHTLPDTEPTWFSPSNFPPQVKFDLKKEITVEPRLDLFL